MSSSSERVPVCFQRVYRLHTNNRCILPACVIMTVVPVLEYNRCLRSVNLSLYVSREFTVCIPTTVVSAL